jgi:hypothetical protein
MLNCMLMQATPKIKKDNGQMSICVVNVCHQGSDHVSGFNQQVDRLWMPRKCK